MRRTTVALISFTLVAGSMSQAANTIALKNRDGSCQVSVPTDWVVESLGLGAHSPDKKVDAIVSSPKMIDTFAQLKQTAQTVYKNSKVTKDSATEFNMEGESITGIPDVYRAIPLSAGKFCIVEVTYKSGDSTVARTIASTLQGGK